MTEPDPAELERLASPPPPVPSFGRYLREANAWAYYHAPVAVSLWFFTVFYVQVWWTSLLVGVLAGASVGNVIGSWRLWRQRVRAELEESAWVDKLTLDGVPLHIAQAMSNFVREGKTHVAAHLMLEWMRATDPEARRWMEEFDALPEEEKKRRQDEAMREIDGRLD